MKKNLLYTALGLMGIMGTLTIGVANAETTITHFTGSNISYTLNQDELFTGVGTITITTGEDTITILDRNLGATVAGTGCEGNCPNRGYLFQWGNNYGFIGTGDLQSNQKDNTLVNADLVGIPYMSGIFHYGNSNWLNDNSKVDLWGGSDEDNVYNLDDKTWQVSNAIDRRGPCPEGFHVPSKGELQKIKSMMGNDANEIHNKLLIPFVGLRGYVFAEMTSYNSAYIRSSTYNLDGSYNSYSRFLYLSSAGGQDVGLIGRAIAGSIRCFYNKYEAYSQTVALSFTGSEGGSVSTGSIEAEEGSSISRDDIEGTVSISGTVVVTGTSDEGYVFSGWLTDCVSGILTTGCSFTGVFKLETYTITYELNGGTNNENNLTGYTIKDSITFENPTKEGYTFDGWFTDAQFTTGITSISTGTTGPITVYAKWTENKKSSGSSGGGGRSNKTSDDEKDAINNPSVTDVTAPLESGSQGDSDDGSPLSRGDTASAERGSTQTYTEEFQEAYEFAHEKGITTMPTINEANMNGKLTRIAMAKMLSYYAINVLGQKPDETRINKFNDITEKLDAQYDSGVTLAYQLGIMGINMPNNNFRPNDEVTRAEFATALSRMLYSTPDGKPYYTTHLAKLKAEKILTNDDYKIKELRGYVMIMLKRSAK